MRFAVAAAGLVAVASASLEGYGHSNMTSPPVYTTEVVTSYTTYCPGPTSVTHNGVTYTVTEATTLTITNCPCTVTKPVYSTTPAAPTTPVAPTYPASSPAASVYPSGNGTAPAPPVYTQKPTYTGTGAYTPPASTSPSAPAYTGAADKVSFGVAGLLAAAGLVAAL